jgi:hypothetical protein
MDVYVYVYSMFVLSYVGRGLAMSWSLIQGVLPCMSKQISKPRPHSGLLHPRKKVLLVYYQYYSPQRCLHLLVVVGLVRLCDPETNAGGSLTTSRAAYAGKVKG